MPLIEIEMETILSASLHIKVAFFTFFHCQDLIEKFC